MKKLISVIVSLLILTIIYWRIDFHKILNVLSSSNPTWLLISLGMVIPITLLTAWKFKIMVPSHAQISFYHSTRLILLASVLNMVLPSKMGDVAKAYFIKDMGELSGSMSVSLVVFEKVFDVLALLLWCSLGLVLYTDKDLLFFVMTITVSIGLVVGVLTVCFSKFSEFVFKFLSKLVPIKFENRLKNLAVSWHEYQEYIWRRKILLIKVSIISILIWFSHLVQIWFFIFTLKAWVPLTINFALTSLSIFAGLLPLTFAGIGTRDAALIFFFQGYLSTPVAAALGVLCSLRYILPAVAGIPFLLKYSNKLTELRNRQNQLEAEI